MTLSIIAADLVVGSDTTCVAVFVVRSKNEVTTGYAACCFFIIRLRHREPVRVPRGGAACNIDSRQLLRQKHRDCRRAAAARLADDIDLSEVFDLVDTLSERGERTIVRSLSMARGELSGAAYIN